MPNYSRSEVVLISYPFSDLTSTKVRPAVVINDFHSSRDLIIVPLTSKTANLRSGEFILQEWRKAGLNIETAVKRGIFTIEENLVRKQVGKLQERDLRELEASLRAWLKL